MTWQWLLVGMAFMLCILLAHSFLKLSARRLEFFVFVGLACLVLWLPQPLSLNIFMAFFYVLALCLYSALNRPILFLIASIILISLILLFTGNIGEQWIWSGLSVVAFLVLVVQMIQGQTRFVLLWLSVLLFMAFILFVPSWSSNVLMASVMVAMQLYVLLKMPPTGDTAQSSEACLDVSEIQAAERSRIYQNIHDDVGAELLRLIYLLDDEGQKKQVKDIMQGLRRAVAQTTQITMDVQQLSDDMVELCRQRLLEANIECETEITNSYNHVFNNTLPTGLLRIMNELLSNIIRHATAQNVHFQLISDQQQLTLRLTDNGCGLDPQKTITNTGRGLRGLQKRALKMGADISWRNNPSGGLTTSVRYLWR
ncbi:ATP-binding protein [Marinicella gelatinilytica]|uniref:ATP-binding protein n=1 Tax=Marinicella gelatinilytica TaxID=2996017 RepID=UPI0022608B0F|nr:ATP-binding protein [Marinicella gelatinilytica]MCX7545927.1 ATP-binding protein [Marinicella gelatinilytica]